MPQRLLAAIVSRWDAQSLDDTFDGPFLDEAPPEDVTFPYVIIHNITSGNVFTLSSSGRFTNNIFQFNIYAKEDNSTDPTGIIGGHMETIHAAFGYHSLSIPSANGAVIKMLKTREVIKLVTQEPRVYRGELDYEIQRVQGSDC